MCSVCGRIDGKKPLSVRTWRCPCGAVHDRDMNAATNILAAGQTERLNACEGQVEPAPGLAPAVEAGTHQDSSTAVVGILTSDGGADVNTEHTPSRSS
ncbi:zinc ribbon domain-containing protein [Nocardia pseudovaccinii]|uniref:zinc ribbon domain-containing protein n=1 Tax=Nocardia pseudovaccinii TaxID=189540 RepID=UPI003D8C27EE